MLLCKNRSIYLQCSREHFNLPDFYGRLGFDELPFQYWPQEVADSFEGFKDEDCMAMAFEKENTITKIYLRQLLEYAKFIF